MKVVVVRHGTRLDSVNSHWHETSPTPYNPPLAAQGIQESRNSGRAIGRHVQTGRVVVHSSPFLRCVQTAVEVVRALLNEGPCDRTVTLRLDSVFGEWLTPDYFTVVSPPPDDNDRSMVRAAADYIQNQDLGPRFIYDRAWPCGRLGSSGEYGESWAAMHSRFGKGVQAMLGVYGKGEVVLVTHGAGCNAVLGYLSRQPLLTRVEVASFAVVEGDAIGNQPDKSKSGQTENSVPTTPTTPSTRSSTSWSITFNSNSCEGRPSPPTASTGYFLSLQADKAPKPEPDFTLSFGSGPTPTLGLGLDLGLELTLPDADLDTLDARSRATATATPTTFGDSQAWLPFGQ